MKFGYVMKEGKPVRILHGSVAVTYDSFGGRHEHPISFIEADSWEEAVSKIKSVGISDKLGNIVAMREALTDISRGLETKMKDCPASVTAHEMAIYKRCKAALAKKPCRNCDMFGGDYKMLHTAWFDWTGSPDGHNDDGTVKMPFGEWLLAKARGCK